MKMQPIAQVQPPPLDDGELRLAFRYADLDLRRFNRAAWRRGFWRTGVGPAVMWAAVFLFCRGMAVWVERLAGPRWVGAGRFVMIGAGIMAVALFAGFLIRWTLLQRAARAAERASALRRGLHVVQMGAAGLRVSAPNCDCFYRWPAVEAVVQCRPGMILRLGTGDYLPLPDSALPAGMSREALIDRIHGWKAGAAAGETGSDPPM
ncbi:MAG: hypothetical protein D6754_14770 [Alphaproteobacteria bacterium]|nr:MAG: hypothetical protein D6754_14770 [Alphaproteobacteria bacterium]